MRRALAVLVIACAGALAGMPGALALAAPAGTDGAAAGKTAAATLRIGSKRFTESYILGELLAQAAAPHAKTEHRQGLGNTAIVLAALRSGDIDVYPEYTGTIDLEILKHKQPAPLAQIQRELAAMGLGMAVPLGFNNTYALAVRGDTHGVRTVSDLARLGGYRFGLSHEFIGRADGWQGLARRYALAQQPKGLDHGIAYEALKQRQVDVIDIYSTDAKIAQYGLRVLEDDMAYFPRYDAVLLYRLDAARRFPAAWRALRKLEGRIAPDDMIAMNAAAEIDGKSFAAIARDWLDGPAANAAIPSSGADAHGAAMPPGAIVPGAQGPATPSSAASASVHALAAASAGELSGPRAARPAVSGADAGGLAAGGAGASAVAPGDAVRAGLAAKLFADDLWKLTRQHILLVLLAVALACAVGIPLGVLAAYAPRLRQLVLALTGMLQTIPSLALLAIMIPLLGTIGTAPALAALFVYALLPIVRNTCTGVCQVPEGLSLAALALGLRGAQKLIHVELPLAMPVILAGVKTAAVMSVGTATIAAFIGAGGYGERITVGLALNDNDMLLAGALPAAVMALITQGLFELLERLALRRSQL